MCTNVNFHSDVLGCRRSWLTIHPAYRGFRRCRFIIHRITMIVSSLALTLTHPVQLSTDSTPYGLAMLSTANGNVVRTLIRK